ncbi:MAG: PKD domain-containing protein [Bacteroidetes bacterium]|nr:MAG: PKD domain-containing protein [Bacteroidota bacterium]
MVATHFDGYSQQTTKKALFLGNSYTAYNSLPNLVENIANSLGDSLIHDRNTPGGQTMAGHASNATSLNKISSQEWDYVVLQSQSQEPSFPPSQVANDVYPYAQQLTDSIRSNTSCGTPLFFMTWGRKNGDASNCAAYPPICTYEGMQQRLRESYMEMASTNQGRVAPVGVAWKRVREEYPEIELYTQDESHPSYAGSYLAASVFYSSIFQKSCEASDFIGSLDSTTARRLRTIASETVLDSLGLWGFLEADVLLDSTFLNYVYLTASYSNADSIAWDFGDPLVGSTSDSLVTVEYLVEGEYTVTLSVYDRLNCESKSINTVVQIQLPSSIDTEFGNRFGQVVFRTDVLGRKIDNLDSLNAGQYYIEWDNLGSKRLRYKGF